MNKTGQMILDWKQLRFPGKPQSGKSRDDFYRFVKCLMLSRLLEEETKTAEMGPTPEEMVAITAAIQSMGLAKRGTGFTVRDPNKISYWKIAARMQI